MNSVVEQALKLWGLEGAQYQLIAARENQVFRIDAPIGPVALRLHRRGYRTDAEISSELHWMAAVQAGGLNVPAPIPALSGDMLQNVDATQVDILTWLNGVMLKTTLEQADPPKRATLYHQLGRQMARLHTISDAWTPPADFKRCAWDRDGLLGDAPLWDRFWDNPALNADDRDLFLAMRTRANADLARIEGTLDYGLIHADLVSTNIMVDGEQMHLIDFDDGGYGFRLFELATALGKMLGAPDYPALRAALIASYTAQRPIDLSTLDLMILLRSATYVGWNVTRINEEDGASRNGGLISTTRRLAQAYLAN